jgi:UDP-glucose 4-epimerase
MNRIKVGIIGANGFVGRALAIELISKTEHFDLHLFSRSSIEGINYNQNVFYHLLELNSSNLSLPKELFEIEVLFYLISDSIPATSWNNATNDIYKNLIPFIDLIEKLANGKLKKIIFTSSAGTIYGDSINLNNEDSPKAPFTPHGISKLTSEYFLEYFWKKYGVNYTIFRISNIYGSGQLTSKGLGIINTILEKHINNDEITIFGDGKTIRNYVYIKDVAKILASSIYHDSVTNNVINLASADNLDINQIISIIEKVTNKIVKRKNESLRTSDASFSLIDNSRLLINFKDFKPTPIEKGILETYINLKNE